MGGGAGGSGLLAIWAARCQFEQLAKSSAPSFASVSTTNGFETKEIAPGDSEGELSLLLSCFDIFDGRFPVPAGAVDQWSSRGSDLCS